jgi:hypothetical protein
MKISVLLVIHILAGQPLTTSVAAETASDTPADSTVHAWFPYIRFDSDIGMVGDYHRTAGGGLLISAFTEDFIIRTDYAVSDETGRMYINIGFVF